MPSTPLTNEAVYFEVRSKQTAKTWNFHAILGLPRSVKITWSTTSYGIFVVSENRRKFSQKKSLTDTYEHLLCSRISDSEAAIVDVRPSLNLCLLMDKKECRTYVGIRQGMRISSDESILKYPYQFWAGLWGWEDQGYIMSQLDSRSWWPAAQHSGWFSAA